MSDSIKTEQTNEAHTSPSLLNGGLGMTTIVLHENSEQYADFAQNEILRLEKDNGLYRGLLIKALYELDKSDPRLVNALRNLMPNI